MFDGDGAAEEQHPPAERRARARLPIAWLGAAIGLTVVVIATIAVMAGRAGSTDSGSTSDSGPLAVGSVDQPGAAGKYCTTVMSALPDDLSGLHKRPLVDPAPGVAAWGDPAVVLRCGIPDPEELTCSSALDQINGVAWLRAVGRRRHHLHLCGPSRAGRRHVHRRGHGVAAHRPHPAGRGDPGGGSAAAGRLRAGNGHPTRQRVRRS